MDSKNFQRPSWDEFFMFQAITCATRHSCLKRGVGAVIVKDKRIIGTGYNGAAAGLRSSLDMGECFYEGLAHEESNTNNKDLTQIKEIFKIYCLAVHAEANAMSQCSRNDVKGSIVYITNFPCPKCVQDVIITNGVSGIKVWKEYLADYTLTIDEKRASERKLLEAGIAVSYIKMTSERIMNIALYMTTIGERTNYQFKGGDKK